MTWPKLPQLPRPLPHTRRAAVLLVSLVVAIWVMQTGWQWRKTIWEETRPIRFNGDVMNAYRWGSEALDQPGGAYNLYRSIARSPQGRRGQYGLDYTPLRLWAATKWVAWTRTHYPKAREWQPDYAFTEPMIRMNTACEVASCGLVVCIAVVAARRAAKRQLARPPLTTGLAMGLWCAGILWLNPAILLNAHAWPQWDVWIVPFFLAGILALLLDAWVVCGFVLAIGALLKGQILMAAGVIPLWLLLSGRWSDLLRLVGGVAMGTIIGTLPWHVTWLRTGVWLLVPVLATYAAWLTASARRGWTWWGGVCLLGLLGVCLPVWQAGGSRWLLPAALSCITIWFAARWSPRKLLWGLAPLSAVGLWLLAVEIGWADFAWFDIGFAYSTRHYQRLTMGPASNLASILSIRFGLELNEQAFDLGRLGLWSVRETLVTAYGVVLVACAWAARCRDREGSPRLLVALTLPWVLMFALMPQMHERYLLWGGAVACLWFVADVGLGLLGGLLAIASGTMIGHAMLTVGDYRYWPSMRQALAATHPDIGWAVLVIALVAGYVCLRSDRGKPSTSTPEPPR